MKPEKIASMAAIALLLAACAPDENASDAPPAADEATPGDPAAGTRPAGQPNEIVKEGRIEAGVECPILRTAGGETYALSLGEADFGPGDYVRITGELADASICMQGKGTLIPLRIDAAEPPTGR
jgi:hypothetical protein